MRLNYYFRNIETSHNDQHQFIASRVPPDNCPANWEFLCGEDVYDQALDALESIALLKRIGEYAGEEPQ